MNIKDRGITVGDLLIILVIFVALTFMVKKFNKNNQTSFNLTHLETKSLKNI